MSRVVYLTLFLLSLLTVLSGCDKSASNNGNTDENQAPAAEQALAADVKQAASDNNAFFAGLEKTAMDAGDDCDKLGTSLNDYLKSNKDAYIASSKTLSKDDGAADLEQGDKIMRDDSTLKKAIDKCADNASVKAFNMAFVDVLMQINE